MLRQQTEKEFSRVATEEQTIFQFNNVLQQSQASDVDVKESGIMFTVNRTVGYSDYLTQFRKFPKRD